MERVIPIGVRDPIKLNCIKWIKNAQRKGVKTPPYGGSVERCVESRKRDLRERTGTYIFTTDILLCLRGRQVRETVGGCKNFKKGDIVQAEMTGSYGRGMSVLVDGLYPTTIGVENSPIRGYVEGDQEPMQRAAAGQCAGVSIGKTCIKWHVLIILVIIILLLAFYKTIFKQKK